MWRAIRLMPRTFPYLRRYRGLAGALIVLTVLGSVIALAQPWPLAFLVDSVLGTKEFPTWMQWLSASSAWVKVLAAVGAGLVLTLITGGAAILDEYVKTKLSLRMVRDFRSDIFQHVQKLSLTQHEDRRSGQFIFQTTTEADNVPIVVETAPPLVESVLTLVGMFFVVFRLNPSLALIASTIVPFVYHASRWYADHIEAELLGIRTIEGRVMSIIYESMAMIRVVKAFSRERHHHEEFVGLSEEAVRARIRITLKQTVFSLAVSLVTGVGTAMVLAVGAYLVILGRLTVGELLVVMFYISAVYRPLEAIGTTLGNLQQRIVPLRLGFQVLDTDPDVADAPGARNLERVKGRVAFENCSFSYAGRKHTLEAISFEALPGEVIAIVGPTGAGKSTVVSLIPRFIDPDEGRVLVDGHDVRDVTQSSLRAHIAVVLQDPLLFSGSIMENIRYGRLDANDDEVVAAAVAANAHDFISSLPNGYQTLLGERGARLSGGERQRISVARAFLRDAPILILDEPTSSVDSRTEAVILDSLESLMQGRTTFMIAHRLGTVRNATKILVMNDGRIVESGTHAELLATGGLYRHLYDAQVGGAGGPAPKAGPTHDGPPVERTLSTARRWVARTATQARLLRPPRRETAKMSDGGGVVSPEATEVPGEAIGPPPPDGTAPAAPPGHSGPMFAGQRAIVILGMTTKIPVGGVVWQTLHYMKGFELLGFTPYYVEAHARTPSMFMAQPDDDGSTLAAGFIESVMRRHGFADQWAYHALHEGDRHFGLSDVALRELYRSAELIINLHGGTVPTDDHTASGRLVFLETDPVNLQIEVDNGDRIALDYLDAHQFHFTFAENTGNPDCGLPPMPGRRVQADAPAGRVRLVGRPRPRPGGAVHHDRQLAAGVAGRPVPGRGLHLEQALRVPQGHRPSTTGVAHTRTGARVLRRLRPGPARTSRLDRHPRPGLLHGRRPLPGVHPAFTGRVHRRQGPERAVAHRVVQRPQRHLPRRRPPGGDAGHRLRRRAPHRRGSAGVLDHRRGGGGGRGDRVGLRPSRRRRPGDRPAVLRGDGRARAADRRHRRRTPAPSRWVSDRA